MKYKSVYILPTNYFNRLLCKKKKKKKIKIKKKKKKKKKHPKA